MLELLAPKLRPGAVVLADNVRTFAGARTYLDFVQSGRNGFQSVTLPFPRERPSTRWTSSGGASAAGVPRSQRRGRPDVAAQASEVKLDESCSSALLVPFAATRYAEPSPQNDSGSG
jgi:hypothetical protein